MQYFKEFERVLEIIHWHLLFFIISFFCSGVPVPFIPITPELNFPLQ